MLGLKPSRKWPNQRTVLKSQRTENVLISTKTELLLEAQKHQKALKTLVLPTILDTVETRIRCLGTLIMSLDNAFLYDPLLNQIILSLVLLKIYDLNTSGDDILKESRLLLATLLRLALALESRKIRNETLKEYLKVILIPIIKGLRRSFRLLTTQT